MRRALIALALVALCSGAAEGRSYKYCQSLTSGRFIPRAQAALDRARARCVPPLTAEWLVVRWANGACQTWHNDAAPVGTDWTTVASGTTSTEVWVKLQSLYARGSCQ